MPELPEVELCARQLGVWSAGRPLREVVLLDPAVVRSKLSTKPADAVPGAEAALVALLGHAPAAPRRHGKRLAWLFGDRALLVHLGMSGRWVRRPVAEAPPVRARLGLGFDGDRLWFLDTRRFGCVVPVRASEVDALLRDGAGPDALSEPLDGPTLASALGGRQAVKVALMDQSRLAGLGNIHAAEACFRAGLAPQRPGASLSPHEWARLARAVVAQLEATLAAVEPAEELRYVSEGGDNPFAVYGRAGEACPRCGGTVAAATQAGRTTFWCPCCQR